MLKVKLIDSEEKNIFSLSPLSVTIQKSLDIPCDDAVVIIPYKKYKSGEKILITDGSEVVFRGIIDEEQIILNNSGKFIKYVARSMMSLFIDNEVCPAEFSKPTETYLGYRFIERFGMDFSKSERVYNGNLICQKGMSVYDVLAEYSKEIYGTYPRVDSTGFFDFKGGKKDEKIIFGNNGNGERYNSYIEYKRPCNRITRVYLKLSDKGYKSVIDNPEAKDTSIVRERYIDGTMNSKTSGVLGDKIIANSNKNYLLVKLVCPRRITGCLGYRAFVDEESVREYSFTVKEIKYTLNSKSESTALLLERRM